MEERVHTAAEEEEEEDYWNSLIETQTIPPS